MRSLVVLLSLLCSLPGSVALAGEPDPLGFGPGFSDEDLEIARQATGDSFGFVTPELMRSFEKLEQDLQRLDQSGADLAQAEAQMAQELAALEALIRDNPEVFEALIAAEQEQAQAELAAVEAELDRRSAPQPRLQPLNTAPQPRLQPLEITPQPRLQPLKITPPPSTSKLEQLRLEPKPQPTLDLSQAPAGSARPVLTPAPTSRLDQLLLRAKALEARTQDDEAQQLSVRLLELRKKQPATRLVQLQARAADTFGRQPIRIGVDVDARPAPALRSARPLPPGAVGVGVQAGEPLAAAVPVEARPAAVQSAPAERTWIGWMWDGLVWAWEGIFGG